jgi:hypothetical protein
MSEADCAQELLDVQPVQLSPKEEEVKEDVLQRFSMCKDNHNYLDTLELIKTPGVPDYQMDMIQAALDVVQGHSTKKDADREYLDILEFHKEYGEYP